MPKQTARLDFATFSPVSGGMTFGQSDSDYSEKIMCPVYREYKADSDGRVKCSNELDKAYYLNEPNIHSQLLKDFSKIGSSTTPLEWIELWGLPANIKDLDEVRAAATGVRWLLQFGKLLQDDTYKLREFIRQIQDHEHIQQMPLQSITQQFPSFLSPAKSMSHPDIVAFTFEPCNLPKWRGIYKTRDCRLELVDPVCLVSRVPNDLWKKIKATKSDALIRVSAALYLRKVFNALLSQIHPTIEVAIGNLTKNLVEVDVLPRRQVPTPFDAVNLALYEEIVGRSSGKLCKGCGVLFTPKKAGTKYHKPSCKQKQYDQSDRGKKTRKQRYAEQRSRERE